MNHSTLVMNEQRKVDVVDRKMTWRYIHMPLVPHLICAEGDHHFQFVDNGRRQHGMVLVKCRACSVGKLLPFR